MCYAARRTVDIGQQERESIGAPWRTVRIGERLVFSRYSLCAHPECFRGVEVVGLD